MLIHQLEINTTGLGITASVEANTGNTVERILAWNQQTFQDEAEAIDLSHLINGTDNIEITTKNIDANRLFTGAFTHTNLENALISITQPMNMTYELSSSNLVTINGRKN